MKAFINGKHTKSGRPFYSLMEMSAASKLPIYDGGKADVIFNWGGGGLRTPANTVVLNKHPLFGKYAQAQAMKKRSEFPRSIPKSYRKLGNVEKFPIVRKPINSYGGHGIILIKSAIGRREKIDTWYQEFIKKVREIRVYFFDGSIGLVEEKFAIDPNEVTWNLHNCLRWQRSRELEASKKLANIVCSAAKTIRLDWGAADILIDRNSKFWVCEINSSPSCWGGKKPKLKMIVKNGVYVLTENERSDLDLSARMWANRMKRFVGQIKN